MNTVATATAPGARLLLPEARTFSKFLDNPLPENFFEQVHDLMRWGPTSQNQQSGRFVVLRSKEAKDRIRDAVWDVNLPKVDSAQATVVFAYDTSFHEYLPKTFPHRPEARERFDDDPALREEEAFRNGTLQAAYFILAIRALGADAGPMSGFHREKVDAALFAGTTWKSNFLCNVGYGDESSLFGRLPRMERADVMQIL
jgi:3-hydroxypropanoate dehydrogenase